MGAFYDKETGQRQKSRRDTEAKNKQKALAQTFAKCMSWFLKTTGPPGVRKLTVKLKLLSFCLPRTANHTNDLRTVSANILYGDEGLSIKLCDSRHSQVWPGNTEEYIQCW